MDVSCPKVVYDNLAEAISDPALDMQDEMMSTMGSFATLLVAMRAKRGLRYIRGWPTLVCLFDTNYSAQPTMDLLRADFEHFKKLSELGTRSATAMVERSLFQHRVVMQTVLMLGDVGWQPHIDFIRRVGDRNRTDLNSQINEDMFQRMRGLEDSSGNRQTAMISQWHHLLQRKVSSEVHHYAEVDTARPAPTRGIEKLPTHLATGRMSELQGELRAVCSYDSRPSWYTTNLDGLVGLVADLELVSEVRAFGDWSRLDRLWLACLFEGAKLLVRRADALATDPWLMILTDVCGRAVLAWEMVEEYEMSRDGDMFQTLKPKTVWHATNPLKVLAITDLNEWHGLSYEWLSPKRILLRSGEGDAASGRLANGAVVPIGVVQLVLKALAEEAFFEVGVTLLRRLSTYLHIDLPKERRRNDLYNMLAHLIVNILGCDEGEMLDVAAADREQAHRCGRVLEGFRVDGGAERGRQTGDGAGAEAPNGESVRVEGVQGEVLRGSEGLCAEDAGARDRLPPSAAPTTTSGREASRVPGAFARS